MARKDDFYITLLKYAREKNVAGETFGDKDVCDHDQAIHPDINPVVIRVALSGVSSSVNISLQPSSPRFIRVLDLEGYFQLLEHEELQEARAASMKALGAAGNAMWLAFGALLVSSAIGITSIYIQVS